MRVAPHLTDAARAPLLKVYCRSKSLKAESAEEPQSTQRKVRKKPQPVVFLCVLCAIFASSAFKKDSTLSDHAGRDPCFLLFHQTQHPPLHLAGGRHRQRIDELDLLRVFVRRELAAHVRLQLSDEASVEAGIVRRATRPIGGEFGRQ